MRKCFLILGGLIALLLAGVIAAPSSATTPGKNGRIAFRRYFDTAHAWGAIFTINPDGTGEQQVTHPPKGTLDDQSDWAPDGSLIAFSRCPKGGSCAIYTVKPDGSALTKISPACPGCGGDSQPGFSPDGHSIVFGRFAPSYGCCAIVIADLQTHALQVVTKGKKPYAIGEPQFSPDGKQISFIEAAQPNDHPRAVFVVNTDGTGLHRVTPWRLNGGDDPDWSPDGKWILFRSNEQLDGQRSQVYVIHPDGTGLKQLTHFAAGTIVLSFSFSPDGKWITFAKSGLAGEPDVFVMRANGTGVRPVTRTTSWDSAPDWGSTP